jgi:hypothetical protein
MTKRISTSLGVILPIVLFYFLNRDIFYDAKKDAPQKEKVAQMMTAKTPVEPERFVASITKKEIKSFRSSYPDQLDVRSEVSQNLHGTPDSLINFAKKLGPLYEKALQNNNDAYLLFDVLNECVLENSVAQSARALCLSNAEKLAAFYPELKERTRKMREIAPLEVSNLVESKNK